MGTLYGLILLNDFLIIQELKSLGGMQIPLRGLQVFLYVQKQGVSISVVYIAASQAPPLPPKLALEDHGILQGNLDGRLGGCLAKEKSQKSELLPFCLHRHTGACLSRTLHANYYKNILCFHLILFLTWNRHSGTCRAAL